MALIKDTLEERQDGSYTRLFGVPVLGGLFSKVHATTIRNGNELESIILEKHADLMTKEQFDLFVVGELCVENKRMVIADTKIFDRDGKEILSKKKKGEPLDHPGYVLSEKLNPYLGTSIEPDMVLLIINEKKCTIIELKDGDTFDTKKADGEVANLRRYGELFQTKFPEYKVKVKVCSFNAIDRAQIVTGLKNRITEKEAMTGKELCAELGISYANIVQRRKTEAAENLIYFTRRLLEIDSVREIIIEELTKPPAKTSETC